MGLEFGQNFIIWNNKYLDVQSFTFLLLSYQPWRSRNAILNYIN